VKSRYWAKTHKYGIELPKSVAVALAVDRKTGTDFWKTALEKEIAFDFRDNKIVPIGYKKIDCHMTFDVKMKMTRKARLVTGGHQMEVPTELTYSSVILQDSVHITFTLAALNDPDVLSADVHNAYLNAPMKECVYTIAGPEFGSTDLGQPVLIVFALYMASNLAEPGGGITWLKPCKMMASKAVRLILMSG
jgi:acetyl/propionyl-CoA carboxylase alpha subunit